MPYVDAARSHWYDTRYRTPLLFKINTTSPIFCNKIITHQIYKTKCNFTLTLKFTNNGSTM